MVARRSIVEGVLVSYWKPCQTLRRKHQVRRKSRQVDIVRSTLIIGRHGRESRREPRNVGEQYERERVRDLFFASLGRVWHVAPSTGRLSYRPAAFLSMNEQYEVREENR